ncbi:MAG: OmpH family outer membrane protein [Rickettsiaceae bacterium]|nr:OmpH family outer membrane protein [Rickettsiaceae bacterium]
MLKYFQISILMLLSCNSFAECAKYNIALVNIQSILENSTSMIYVKNTVEEMAHKLQTDLQQKEAELNVAEKQILDMKNNITEEEFQSKVAEFNKKVTRVQQKIREEKLRLEKVQSNAINRINEVALEIIKKISNEKCIEIVLPSINALYASEKLNITE